MLALTSALTGGLLVVIGFDAAWGNGLWRAMDHMARAQWPDHKVEQDPQLLPTVGLWLLGAAVGTVVHAFGLGIVDEKANHSALPTQAASSNPDSQPLLAAGGGAAAVPSDEPVGADPKYFNYVDPSNLSNRFSRSCHELLFPNADALLYFFGFQADNVKCQVRRWKQKY